MANKKNEICFLCGKTKNQTDRLIKDTVKLSNKIIISKSLSHNTGYF